MEITKKAKKYLTNKYFNFVLSTIILLLLVIWTGNFFLLLIQPIIVDFYLTKKVNWTFWKKKGVKKQKWWIEWIDAAIFAIIAATIIRTLLIEAYTIPTSSMEKSMLVGDYLFVSKYHYGPRLPITPVAFPFAHHTMPGTKNTKSFTDAIQMRYKRLIGLEDIENDDVVVFNFPTGDTVAINQQGQSYYQLCRDYGHKNVNNDVLIDPRTGQQIQGYFGEIVYRPVDKRENYIKRCVAIAGDSLQVIDGELYINSERQNDLPHKQYKYLVTTDGNFINPKVLENLSISNEDKDASRFNIDYYAKFMAINSQDVGNTNIYPLPESKAEQLRTITSIKSVRRIIKPAGYKESYIFPHTEAHYKIDNKTIANLESKMPDSVLTNLKKLEGKTFDNNQKFYEAVGTALTPAIAENYVTVISSYSNQDKFSWNEDNFGPIWIPKEGVTIELNIENLPLYERIIDVYEGNDLEIKGENIFINGEKATSYTFKMDYYFMMGDSRHNSADSRFWGYVPDDHIVGKGLFVWLSMDKDKPNIVSKIRWNRFFMGIK